jgi:S-DNA-T family DNA segregation ATPase FtsK/SpoIIIE
MSVRLGWRRGRPDSPLTVSLGGLAAVALRGDAEPIAPVLRWIMAQLVGLHDSRDLSIVAAIEPAWADAWGWLVAAPHARPWTAPVAGAHVATSAEGAAELIGKLREVIELRRLAAAGGPAHRDIAIQPRVLAVLDNRLCGPDAEYVSMAGPALGVHVVRLVPASERAPASCSICIDIDPDGDEVVIHVASRPGESWSGAPDGVSVAYARDITDALR